MNEKNLKPWSKYLELTPILKLILASFFKQALEKQLNMDYTIVTKVSESDVTHPVIQTVADGKVDLVADTFVANYHRYKFVDFSYPIQGFMIIAHPTKSTNI